MQYLFYQVTSLSVSIYGSAFVPYTIVDQTKTVVSMREGACVCSRIVGLERSVVLSIVERSRGHRLRSTYLFEMDVLKPQNTSCIACPYVANNFRVQDGEQSLLNFRGILNAMLS